MPTTDGNLFLSELGFNPDKPIKNADLSNRYLVGISFNDIEFINCDFSNSDLSYSTFQNCNLYKCNFNFSMLYVTRIKNSILIRTNFSGSFLYGAQIKNVEPTLAEFNSLNFETMFRQTHIQHDFDGIRCKNFSYCDAINLTGNNYSCNGEKIEYREFKQGEKWLRQAETFNLVKRLLKEGGYLERSAKFYYLERRARRRAEQGFFNKCTEYLFEIFCGYGERPLRSIVWLLLIWFVFAFVYPLLPNIESDSGVSLSGVTLDWLQVHNHNELFLTLHNSLYFSAITMTTLGYGDGLPSGWAKEIVILQTFFGMLFFAIFVATITRKVIRD